MHKNNIAGIVKKKPLVVGTTATDVPSLSSSMITTTFPGLAGLVGNLLVGN
jgi:hypothetical protein